jgi:putative endonuclease
MQYFIYILYSEGSDRYYVGYTYDVQARLKDHNEGDRPRQTSKYTFKHRPWKLVGSFFAGESRGEAMKVERYIKRQKSRAFIEKLVPLWLTSLFFPTLKRHPGQNRSEEGFDPRGLLARGPARGCRTAASILSAASGMTTRGGAS